MCVINESDCAECRRVIKLSDAIYQKLDPVSLWRNFIIVFSQRREGRCSPGCMFKFNKGVFITSFSGILKICHILCTTLQRVQSAQRCEGGIKEGERDDFLWYGQLNGALRVKQVSTHDIDQPRVKRRDDDSERVKILMTFKAMVSKTTNI